MNFRPSILVELFRVGVAVVGLAMAAAVWLLFRETYPDVRHISTLLVAVVLLWFLYGTLDWFCTQYSYRDGKIQDMKGILFRRISIIEDRDVRNIIKTQNFLQMILGYCNIEFDTVGDAGVEVKFQWISLDFWKEVDEAVSARRGQ